jgi:hypothetical protein
LVAGGANLLHSIEKPRSATRGDEESGMPVIHRQFPLTVTLG